MSIRSTLQGLALVGPMLWAGASPGNPPMSAIDWLSRSVTAPAVAPPADVAAVVPPVGQPPAPGIDVSVLGTQQLDAVGLIPVSVSGLPRDLWQGSASADLIALLKAGPMRPLPALQDLLYTLLLAEVDPPADAGASGSFLIARVDRLLDFGALDQAQALLQVAGTRQPALFRRWFDVELLLGQETAACQTMAETPEIAPTLPARIYCLAHGGDWSAAVLTLKSAEALGMIAPQDTDVLTRFLDTGGDDTAAALPPPAHPTPLVWRMMEAIGEPLPTNTLPVAFAQADLRSNIGWKAQIEAAERLARTGAIPPNQLIGIYTAGKPSASGDPWDRVAAVQKFDAAMRAHDGAAIGRTLPVAWDAITAAGLDVPFAALYAKPLAALHLTGKPADLAFRIGLLSPDAEAIAGTRIAADPAEAFLIGLARGHVDGLTPPDAMGAAISAGFAPGASVGDDLDALIAGHRLGEAILRAVTRISDGASGDLRGVTEGLAALRKAGLESAARQTALQLMLIARAG
jgi:hypothetical protein